MEAGSSTKTNHDLCVHKITLSIKTLQMSLSSMQEFVCNFVAIQRIELNNIENQSHVFVTMEQMQVCFVFLLLLYWRLKSGIATTLGQSWLQIQQSVQHVRQM